LLLILLVKGEFYNINSVFVLKANKGMIVSKLNNRVSLNDLNETHSCTHTSFSTMDTASLKNVTNSLLYIRQLNGYVQLWCNNQIPGQDSLIITPNKITLQYSARLPLLSRIVGWCLQIVNQPSSQLFKIEGSWTLVQSRVKSYKHRWAGRAVLYQMHNK
jgi:hypothetical protein